MKTCLLVNFFKIHQCAHTCISLMHHSLHKATILASENISQASQPVRFFLCTNSKYSARIGEFCEEPKTDLRMLRCRVARALFSSRCGVFCSGTYKTFRFTSSHLLYASSVRKVVSVCWHDKVIARSIF